MKEQITFRNFPGIQCTVKYFFEIVEVQKLLHKRIMKIQKSMISSNIKINSKQLIVIHMVVICS